MEGATAAELADYIRLQLAELARLARLRRLDVLAYLIAIAELEAANLAQLKPDRD